MTFSVISSKTHGRESFMRLVETTTRDFQIGTGSAEDAEDLWAVTATWEKYQRKGRKAFTSIEKHRQRRRERRV